MIELPWPSSTLSGHNNGHWRSKARIVATHRAWAFHATRAVKIKVEGEGDIRICVRFIPPHRRGDRTNYPNLMKPYFDGVAEALGINDRRFLPSYEFCDPEKPGKIEIVIPGFDAKGVMLDSEGYKKSGLGDAQTPTKPMTNSLYRSEADDA